MMSVWSSLVGQEAAVAKLSEAAASARAIVASRGGAHDSDDARSMSHAWLITGPPGSGRSTALRALAQAMASDPLVVDDLDLADIATATQVEAALARSEVVLASASTEKVATTFRGAISTMREREALVVLWPGMRPADQAAGISLRSVTDPRAMTLPGRGALVYRGTCLPIQIVQPRPEDNDRPIEHPV